MLVKHYDGLLKLIKVHYPTTGEVVKITTQLRFKLFFDVIDTCASFSH